MPELRDFNAKELQAKIDHYAKLGDFVTARKFIQVYDGRVQGFNRDQAEFELIKMEKGEKPLKKIEPQKKDKKGD